MSMTKAAIAVTSALAFAVLAGCGDKQAAEVSYKADVAPILANNCGECHNPGGAGAVATGLVMDNHANLMKGTKYGPVVIPGSSISSTLYLLVAGKADPSIKMPHGKQPLTAAQIATIETWIEQGAKEN